MAWVLGRVKVAWVLGMHTPPQTLRCYGAHAPTLHYGKRVLGGLGGCKGGLGFRVPQGGLGFRASKVAWVLGCLKVASVLGCLKVAWVLGMHTPPQTLRCYGAHAPTLHYEKRVLGGLGF